MAYVVSGTQKRRGEDAPGPDGTGSNPGGGSAPLSAPEKQDSTAKTPMRAQVEANRGYSQEAAINRVYKPFEQEVATQKSGYQDQAQAYKDAEAKKTSQYNVDQGEINKQVGAGKLQGPLSQVLGGYNESMDPGAFNLIQKPVDAAKELAGRNATTSLLRGGSGNYGMGMAALDNALLRATGGIGQLGQKIGQGTNELRQYGLAQQQSAMDAAKAQRQAQVADTQNRLKEQIGSSLASYEVEGDRRNQARTDREVAERQAAMDPGRRAIQDALASIAGDQAGWGNQAEFDALRALDASKYIDGDVMQTGRYSQFGGDELGHINALRGMLGMEGVAAGDAGDQSFGFRQGDLQRDIQQQLDSWNTRKGAELNRREEERKALEMAAIQERMRQESLQSQRDFEQRLQSGQLQMPQNTEPNVPAGFDPSSVVVGAPPEPGWTPNPQYQGEATLDAPPARGSERGPLAATSGTGLGSVLGGALASAGSGVVSGAKKAGKFLKSLF